MEIKEFTEYLKNKYNYPDELISLLQKAIPALITYYGEDKKNIIYNVLNDCEIHIQKDKENAEEYLNNYFQTNKKWDMPLLAGAFQHNELYLKDNQVQSKSIIFVKTEYLHKHKPFNYNDDKRVSNIIHELCHAIKGYGRTKVENGKVIKQTGLIVDTYNYNAENNSFEEIESLNTGLEEALNSYDESEVMTIMTGVPHELGSYEGMTPIARELMKHKNLAEVIRKCQFTDSFEWIEFLGKENAEILVKNFEDWIEVLYCSPAEVLNNRDALINKMTNAIENLSTFVKNYNTPNEVNEFKQARTEVDKKNVKLIEQVVMYTKEPKELEQKTVKSL